MASKEEPWLFYHAFYKFKRVWRIKRDIETGVVILDELFDGMGSYEFEWEVKAERQGFDNYEVIQIDQEYPMFRSITF